MYIIHFDTVAVVLALLALFLFNKQKKIKNNQGKRMSYLLYAVLGSSVFSIISSLYINALPESSSFMVILTTSIYYVFHNSIPLLVAYYVNSITSNNPERSIGRILFLLPWMGALLIILLNPIFKTAFFVNHLSEYTHGPFLAVLYLIALSYVFLSVRNLLYKKNRIPANHRYIYIAALMLPVLSIIIQNFKRQLSLESFATTLSILFILLTIQNINEMKDGGTGLFHRTAFYDFIDQSFATQRPFSVIIIWSAFLSGLHGLVSIENYREITKTYSKKLQGKCGKYSLLGILDNGLYGVIIEGSSISGRAGALAIELAKQSSELLQFSTMNIQVPAIQCIINCPEQADKVSDIVDYGEQLTAISEQGGNRHIFYGKDFIRDKTKRETAIAEALKQAIIKSGLKLRYQALYASGSRNITAVEALLTCTLDNDETIYQSDIIRIAEKTAIGQELGLLFLDTAIRCYVESGLHEKTDCQLQLRMLPSLSIEMDWPRSILRIIRERNMDPSKLCLELTETTAVSAGTDLKLNMELLNGNGVHFALDDYGSGYTDIRQIITLPFSIIKLDKKIVQNGLKNNRDLKMLKATVQLFKHLNKSVIAEGIETESQRDAMIAMGCDGLQGYYYGKPMSDKDILSIFEKKHRNNAG